MMGLLTRVLIVTIVASVSCFGATAEKQQAVEDFWKSVKNLESALNDIVQHSATEVRAASVLKEAEEAEEVYNQQFIPSIKQLIPFLLSDKDEKSWTYDGGVVQELRNGVQNISLSQDELLSLILGDDIMQTDGARLEISLSLLTTLVQRFAGSTKLQEVSLGTVKEVSAVAGAAMEAVAGVRDAVKHAEEDAKTAFINTLKGQKLGQDLSEEGSGSEEDEDISRMTDGKIDSSLNRIRKKRSWFEGPFVDEVLEEAA